jgi:hypothetical protein
MHAVRVLDLSLVEVEGLGAVRKAAAPTPSPSSPAARTASRHCSADVLARGCIGTLAGFALAAAHSRGQGYGRVMEENSMQSKTLQDLRDELDRTRPAWEELADLDDVLENSQLPALVEDARRHQLVQKELLRRPSND